MLNQITKRVPFFVAAVVVTFTFVLISGAHYSSQKSSAVTSVSVSSLTSKAFAQDTILDPDPVKETPTTTSNKPYFWWWVIIAFYTVYLAIYFLLTRKHKLPFKWILPLIVGIGSVWANSYLHKSYDESPWTAYVWVVIFAEIVIYAFLKVYSESEELELAPAPIKPIAKTIEKKVSKDISKQEIKSEPKKPASKQVPKQKSQKFKPASKK